MRNATIKNKESWANYREWVAVALNVFLAPDGLVATETTIDTFAQILECRAQELAAEMSVPAVAAPSADGKAPQCAPATSSPTPGETR